MCVEWKKAVCVDENLLTSCRAALYALRSTAVQSCCNEQPNSEGNQFLGLTIPWVGGSVLDFLWNFETDGVNTIHAPTSYITTRLTYKNAPIYLCCVRWHRVVVERTDPFDIRTHARPVHLNDWVWCRLHFLARNVLPKRYCWEIVGTRDWDPGRYSRWIVSFFQHWVVYKFLVTVDGALVNYGENIRLNDAVIAIFRLTWSKLSTC